MDLINANSPEMVHIKKRTSGKQRRAGAAVQFVSVPEKFVLKRKDVDSVLVRQYATFLENQTLYV